MPSARIWLALTGNLGFGSAEAPESAPARRTARIIFLVFMSILATDATSHAPPQDGGGRRR
jgi:hypothetical protein